MHNGPILGQLPRQQVHLLVRFLLLPDLRSPHAGFFLHEEQKGDQQLDQIARLESERLGSSIYPTVIRKHLVSRTLRY